MMDNNEKEFSAEDSLKLIRSMIESTKVSISDKSHFFLLWGYATMIACLLDYVLLVIVKTPYHYVAWSIMLLTLIPHSIYIYRDKKKETVRTFINDATSYVWIIIGFAFLALTFVFGKVGYQFCFPIYILLYGIGTFITGSLIKFKPLIVGGIICMVLVVIAPYLIYSLQILLCAFAILVSYIIPGHLLKSQYHLNNKTAYGK